MANDKTSLTEVPAVLPGSENEEEREKLIEQSIGTSAAEESDLLREDDDELDEELPPVKPSKKKFFAAFAGFVLFFVLLLGIICWFFGIGVFAASKSQAIDRTTKTNSSAPVTEEEKLKMALNLVAEKHPVTKTEQGLQTAAAIPENVPGSSLTIPNDDTTSTAGNISLPGETTATGPSTSMVSKPLENEKRTEGAQDNEVRKESDADQEKSGKSYRSAEREVAPAGRSLFFGKESKASLPLTNPNSINQTTNFRRETASVSTQIPFGSLLPVRLIGSVYTLRNSGGFVRMELTRKVEGDGYSYPTGTVVVGTLRGSEYKRAFISIVGIIDTKTGSLIKFSGEVLGTDGASGMEGRRRKVSSAWSRALAGLREAGTAALGTLGNLRSGGTVVISDSTQKATDQLAGLIDGKRQDGEFVEIAAGSSGFVLVTNLPAEDKGGNENDPATRVASAVLPGGAATESGLADEELADLFSGGSAEKMRAALPRMTPAFRKLAEQALQPLARE